MYDDVTRARARYTDTRVSRHVEHAAAVVAAATIADPIFSTFGSSWRTAPPPFYVFLLARLLRSRLSLAIAYSDSVDIFHVRQKKAPPTTTTPAIRNFQLRAVTSEKRGRECHISYATNRQLDRCRSTIVPIARCHPAGRGRGGGKEEEEVRRGRERAACNDHVTWQ